MLILGGEVGELEEFRGYLSSNLGLSLAKRESAISGKEISTSLEVCKTARFISLDEAGDYSRITSGIRLEPDRIKDIDSIVEALKEKFYYAGNIKLGKFSDVEQSDHCIDSSTIYNGEMVYEGSKNVAFAKMVRKYEYGFGVFSSGESRFVIKGFGTWKDARCFEIFRTFVSSDCYFTGHMEGCQNCMFSFNQRNRNFLIGNLEMPKDKYMELKAKLLGEIRDELRRKKKAPGIWAPSP